MLCLSGICATTGGESQRNDAGTTEHNTKLDTISETSPDPRSDGGSQEKQPEPKKDQPKRTDTQPEQPSEGEAQDNPPPVCKAGTNRPCYDGPSSTKSKGLCKSGTQFCNAQGQWDLCLGQVLPQMESCDNKDEDCDGQIDEALTRPCFRADPKLQGTGICRAGTERCKAGKWSETCTEQVLPKAETCNNKDDDCNGKVDEKLRRRCYTGLPETRGKGICKDGTQVCAAGNWGNCNQEIRPTQERCNGKDDDCNGKIDDTPTDEGKSCTSTGRPSPCDKGLTACEQNRVVCKVTSNNAPELCDGKDNNCNGTIDEKCQCTNNTTRPCYTATTGCSPSGTGTGMTYKCVGTCVAGVQTCVAGKWDTCQKQVAPSAELCDNKDNDCDGKLDNNVPERACYPAPSNTRDVGICRAGKQSCAAGKWGLCTQAITPSAEICDGKDNNCNGQNDENLASRSCYPTNTTGCTLVSGGSWQCKGLCKTGTQSCQGGVFGACVGVRTPTLELCDQAEDDEDCDGIKNNGCCLPVSSARKWTPASVGSIFTIAMSTDTTSAVLGGLNKGIKSCADPNKKNAVELWDLKAGKLTQSFSFGTASCIISSGISPNKRWFAAGNAGLRQTKSTPTVDGSVQLWSNGASRKLAATIQLTEQRADPKKPNFALHLEFSRDSRYLATGSRQIQLWELSTQTAIRKFTSGFQYPTGDQPSQVRSFAFHPQNTKLATAHSDCKVRIWSLQTGKWEQTLDPKNPVLCSVGANAVRWLVDGQRVAVGYMPKIEGKKRTVTSGNKVQIWNLVTGQIQVTLAPPSLTKVLSSPRSLRSVTLSPDGRWLSTLYVSETKGGPTSFVYFYETGQSFKASAQRIEKTKNGDTGGLQWSKDSNYMLMKQKSNFELRKCPRVAWPAP